MISASASKGNKVTPPARCIWAGRSVRRQAAIPFTYNESDERMVPGQTEKYGFLSESFGTDPST